MIFGLRGKILLIALLVVSGVLAASILTASYVFSRHTLSAYDSRSLAIAQGLVFQLEHRLAAAIDLNDLQGFDRQCAAAVDSYPGVSYALVVAPDGRVLFRNPGSSVSLDAAALQAAMQRGAAGPLPTADASHAVIAPLADASGVTLAAVIVGFPRALVTHEQAAILLLILVIGTGILLLGLRALCAAKDAAAASSLARSRFLASMGHEIRTPLNAILGHLHLLGRDGPGPAQTSRLTRIELAARHLLVTIDDLLDIARGEPEQLSLERDEFDLSALLEQIRSMIEECAQAKGVQIRCERQGLPDRLRGDVARLRQVLLKYAGNAVLFTDWGTVDLRAQLVAEEGDDLLVRFEVTDTGIGIPAEQLDDRLPSFSQIDGSTAGRCGGSGLGLAITAQLARSMGGESGVENTPGQGSRFWFTARLGRVASRHTPDSTPQPIDETALRARHAGKHLLLVEDDPVNAEVTRDLLAWAGLVVDTAADGQAALAKVRRHRYDLILMDVQMPIMDGLAATRAIRAMRGWRETPILALTANIHPEDRQACLAAGMNALVAKPIEPPMLFAELEHWLSAGEPPPADPLPLGSSSPGTATPDAPSSTDILDTIPGLDIGRGLDLLRNNADKYLALLRRFADEHGDDVRHMSAHLARGDRTAASQLAHALKGVAGNLGVVAVATAAARLDDALRAATPPDQSQLDTLLTDLGQALGVLTAVLDDAGTGGSHRPDQATMTSMPCP